MQQAVEIKSRGLTLRGIVHRPDNVRGKIPAVIIFHGYGGHKMGPNFIFTRLSRQLESRGIASVRFDFAGSGESDGDFIDMTLSCDVHDSENILKYVRNLEFVHKDRISVLGFSMGGAVASILAGGNKEHVHSLCLWAPAGNMGQIVRDNWLADRYSKAAGKSYYDIAGLPMGNAFIEDVTAAHIYKKASGYDKNVLILHGDEDEVVPLSASEKYIEVYGERSKLKVISKANHCFERLDWAEEAIGNSLKFFDEAEDVAY